MQACDVLPNKCTEIRKKRGIMRFVRLIRFLFLRLLDVMHNWLWNTLHWFLMMRWMFVMRYRMRVFACRH